MAVEARRVDPFHTQMISNRDFIATKNAGATDFYASQAEDFIPLAATVPPDHPILPPSCLQQPRMVPEMFTVKPSLKTDSGLTSNYNAATVTVPRINPHKRSRDAFGDHLPVNHFPQKMSKASPFLGQEAAFEFQRHQSEIDRLISQHTERLRLELGDRVKQQWKALLSSIHDSVVGKLKEKDDEIQRMGKMNWLLQEKVKSLVMENQIWRGLAQTNEAAANSLRSDLEHALARGGGVDDAESCCGSNDPGRAGADGGDAAAESRSWGRWCRACGPSHHDCPACGFGVTASVHVNL